MFAKLGQAAVITASTRLVPFSKVLAARDVGNKTWLSAAAAAAGAAVAGATTTVAFATPAPLSGPTPPNVFDAAKDAYKGRIVSTAEVISLLIWPSAINRSTTPHRIITIFGC